MNVQIFKDHKLEVNKSIRCPYCNTVANGAAGTDHMGMPTDGDIAVCMHCAEIAVYAGKGMNLSLQKPDEDLMTDLKNSESWEKIVFMQNKIRSL